MIPTNLITRLPLAISDSPASYSDSATIELTHDGYALYLERSGCALSMQTKHYVFDTLTSEEIRFLTSLDLSKQIAAVILLMGATVNQ